MLSAASTVFPGVVDPEAVPLKRDAHEFPPETVQDVSTFASVFILAVGTETVDGTDAPGDAPVAVSTRLFAVRNAFVIPRALVQLLPTLPPGDMKGASAQTAATVVTSLMTYELPAPIVPQGPSAVISQRLAFAPVPEVWPPFDSK